MKIIRIFPFAAVLFMLAGLQQTAYSQTEDFNSSYESSKVGSIEEDDLSLLEEAAASSLFKSSCLNMPVNLYMRNENLASGLQKIARQAGINLVYNDALVNVDGISIVAKNEPLRDVLDKLFTGREITYREFKNGQIAICRLKKAADKGGVVKGVVRDDNGETLTGASVVIVETGAGSATDEKGNFLIKNVRPGSYTIRVSFIGFETENRQVVVAEGKILDVNINLRPKAFQIGGIEVVGTTDLLPKDVNTKTVISSGEIEHYQASSIKDVLDLVPGVQKSDNPGLGKTSQIAVRGDESDKLSAFGTLVVIDGTPVSNNANLQFERPGGSTIGNTNVGGGVDLRTIPADNIESIEVVSGLPSVRYGDATEGVINIKSKIGAQPHRLKVKNNPDTREANMGGGFALGINGLSYNVNLAQSERDVRKTGDEYSRITAQSVFSSLSMNKRLEMNTKANAQIILDEEEPKGDAFKTRNYNRGYTLGLSNWGTYKTEDAVSAFDYNAYVTLRRENSMKSKIIQADIHVVGKDTISSYLGKVETKGIEWTAGGRLELNRIYFTGDLVHKVLAGTDVQYNANTGEGVIIDTNYSYYGLGTGKKSYNFNDIPGQTIASIYVEDKITGNLFFDFNLMLGFRYEMYRPYKFNLKGLIGKGDIVESHQGTFFNPRLNLMIYFSNVNQLRLTAGITSKSPSMSSIYPPEDVFRWRNPADSSIQYFRYDRRVPELKGWKENQYEVAYDHKFFGSIGTSFSVYYKERKKEYESQSIPVFATAEKDGITNVYYIDSYSLSQNVGWTISKGAEMTIRTNTIKPLNMNFQITGSYSHSNASSNSFFYDSTPDSAKGQFHNFLVPNVPGQVYLGFYYPASGKWSDRLQLNYYVKYILAPLGLWVTLRAEQLVFERSQSYNQEPKDYNKLTPSEKFVYNYEREVKYKSVKWLFNLNISKSLFKGAEVSIYVNNFLDDPGIRRYLQSSGEPQEEVRNPALFYGIEYSMTLDNLF